MHLCAGCTDGLENDLRDVESTVEAIWASAARMDAGAGSVGSSGHSVPQEPSNSRAYDTGRTLNVILTGWARALGHQEPHAVKAANVLLAQIREVRTMDWAPVLKMELRDALNDCRRATDTSVRRVFAGTCPTVIDGTACETPVYTPAGKPEARCSTCGVVWDVTDWRERAMNAAARAFGTAAEVSRILSDPARGVALRQNTIRVWVNRKKLVALGVNGDGNPVYQIRKVRNLWERSLALMEARRHAA
jgi:hypothetical protein